MERQCAGVDAKEGLAAYHFNAPVVEVEGIVRRDSFRFKGFLIVEAICYREVGQGGDTGRGRWGN